MPERWDAVGLSAAEYRDIERRIGRQPNDLELGMFGAMWSEHCSYKSSRAFLGRLPSRFPGVLLGPGENAGVLDIGDGHAIAVRIESHNHPSAIEPLQGAATGVGGILRDIFAVGARPVALLDGLCFGPPDDRRNRHIAAGVVAGIAHYGNAVGVPTVGGETVFAREYATNPLVNVCCLGYLRHAQLQRGAAPGLGNHVWLIGNRTGRDGIHGASLLASRTFDERPEEMRPTVQVGDPFVGKLLIEAALELADSGLLKGLNDLGAAGITSAASEMSGRAKTGVLLDLDAVPLRAEGMTPYEIMLSESQERMLVVVAPEDDGAVEAICGRWGLVAARIGTVTADRRIRVRAGGQVRADLPVRDLTGGAPRYRREVVLPPPPVPWVPPSEGATLGAEEAAGVLLEMLGHPNHASKRWIYRQYDHQVQTNTVIPPGAGDAAVLRHRETGRGIAVALDLAGPAAALDPFAGGALLVAESARNVACAGGRPAGLVDCLNFASPEDPAVMGAFLRTIAGMAAACRRMAVPVLGGNVSFYNGVSFSAAGDGDGIPPTPAVAMVGLLPDAAKARGSGLRRAGEVLCLLGPVYRVRLDGAAYQQLRWGESRGAPLRPDWHLERALCQVLAQTEASAAHDCGSGGLAVACAEMVLTSGDGVGVELDLPTPRGRGQAARVDNLLFGEGPGRALLAVDPAALPELGRRCAQLSLPWRRLGWTTATGGLVIRVGGRSTIRLEPGDLRAWEEALPRWF